jgi:hypothetical protein
VIGSQEAGIGAVAAMGLALGASPFGIVGVILLLNSARPLRNAMAFTLGWIFSITVVAIASVALFPPPSTPPTSAPVGATIAELLLGATLLILGAVQWRRRSAGRTGAEPAWMSKLRTLGPVLAFAVGAFLPTYALIFPAIQAIEQEHLPTGQTIAAFVVFLVLGTIGLIVPIALYALRPQTSAATLERWRTWLLGNQRGVGAVIFTLLGLALLVRGGQGLIG